MFLSNLEIDVKNKEMATWMHNPYKIHQRLWMGFENQKSETIKPDFLYRLEENFKREGEPTPRILVLSNVSPIWEEAFNIQGFQLKKKPQILNLNLDHFIKDRSLFRFSIKANPTKKTKDLRSFFKKEIEEITNEEEIKAKIEALSKTLQKNEWERIKSKRIGIYRDSEQIEWLHRKGNVSGFQIHSLSFTKGEKQAVKKQNDGTASQNIDLFTVTFTGTLLVTDVDKFKKAYMQGIGSGKAFGCGMLLLARD